MNRKQLQACRGRLYSRAPLIGGWLRRQAARALAREGSVEAARLLAEAVARSDDGQVRELARDALRRLTNPRHLEAVGALWLETRDPELTRLLDECPWLAQAPLRVQVLHALLRGRPEVVEAAEPRAIDPLLQACADHDAALAARARQVLEGLKTAEGRETLCRRAMLPGQELAREVAVVAGYAPREPGQRTLFYFLTGQWDAYESLDFDQSLLRAAYQSADEETRRHVAARARATGRVEWVAVVTGGRRQLRLGAMTDAEWQVTADVLQARAQWPELWRLAQEAPPPWSARLLLLLQTSGWRPADAPAFDDLLRLARGWQRPDLAALVRERAALSGHTEPVTALAFTPDGRLLVSGGGDGAVRLWELPEGRALGAVEAHPVKVTALAVSSDGSTLLTAARDGTLRLWGLPDGRPLRTLREDNHEALSVALSPDGRVLAAGLADGTVCLWDLPDGSPRARLRGHQDAVSSVAVSPDGQILASAGGDKTVRLWDLPDGHFRRMLLSGDWVTALAFSPDGRVLASSGYDRVVRLWRPPAGDPAGKLEGHTGDVTCLAISPDGRVLASGGQERAIRLWGLREGRCLRALESPTGLVGCVAFSPDGRTFASGGKDRVVRLWDLRPVRLGQTPVGQTNLPDLAWVEEVLRDGTLPAAERAALEFVAALIRTRLQFAIGLGEVSARVTAGEFDIEIAG
jgi:hypothetical protein